MSRKYTANEMREMALVEESYGWDVVAKMLRQAADMIEREKRKPVRNLDKYGTEKEAFASFVKSCDRQVCSECRFRDKETEHGCAIAWPI